MAHEHNHCDHGHSHHHSHHGHHHAPSSYGKAFAIGISLNLIFVVVELIAGFASGSVALVADASHNFSDVIGLALAWMGSILTLRKPTLHFTYGLKRSSILAALGNALILLIAVGAILWEAAKRIQSPQPIVESTVLVVASIGIVINIGTAFLFFSGRKTDINLRGAFLHMVADAAISLGVVLSSLLIMGTGWLWMDPVVSILIALVIIHGTWGLLKESLRFSMDAVPSGINPVAVKKYLNELDNVKQVHDLHIWGMSTTETALTAHLVMAEGHKLSVKHICESLKGNFGINHSTIQLELENCYHGCEEAHAP